MSPATRQALRALLPLACAALPATALVACGSDHPKTSAGPQALLRESFQTTAQALHSARVDARLTLQPDGLLALGGPIALHVSGPLRRGAGARATSADLAATATIAGQRYPAGFVASGGATYLVVQGSAYRLGKGTTNGKPSSGTAAKALPLDASRWITDPQDKGSEQVAGVATTHVAGDVDAAKLLDDVGGLIPAAQRGQVAAAITTATADVWLGTADKIVRQLALNAKFKFPQGSQSPIPGLQSGTIRLRLTLRDVNGAVPPITAPKEPKPLSELPSDNALAGLLACLGGAGSQPADLGSCAAKLVR